MEKTTSETNETKPDYRAQEFDERRVRLEEQQGGRCWRCEAPFEGFRPWIVGNPRRPGEQVAICLACRDCFFPEYDERAPYQYDDQKEHLARLRQRFREATLG
jgi:hypothetical protein